MQKLTRRQHRQAVRYATRIGKRPTRRQIRAAYARYLQIGA